MCESLVEAAVSSSWGWNRAHGSCTFKCRLFQAAGRGGIAYQARARVGLPCVPQLIDRPPAMSENDGADVAR